MENRFVRIKNLTPVSNTAEIIINGKIMPFYEATIKLKAGEMATITLKTRADLIDVQALEKHTNIKIEKKGNK